MGREQQQGKDSFFTIIKRGMGLPPWREDLASPLRRKDMIVLVRGLPRELVDIARIDGNKKLVGWKPFPSFGGFLKEDLLTISKTEGRDTHEKTLILPVLVPPLLHVQEFPGWQLWESDDGKEFLLCRSHLQLCYRGDGQGGPMRIASASFFKRLADSIQKDTLICYHSAAGLTAKIVAVDTFYHIGRTVVGRQSDQPQGSNLKIFPADGNNREPLLHFKGQDYKLWREMAEREKLQSKYGCKIWP